MKREGDLVTPKKNPRVGTQSSILPFNQRVGRLMLEANSGPIMRARVFWVLSMLLLCAWSSQPISLDDEVVESSAPTNQQQNWNQASRPIWQSGWSPQVWQPLPGRRKVGRTRRDPLVGLSRFVFTSVSKQQTALGGTYWGAL